MAAFSGHREDGDELLGCCFSVAYSHVEERWWKKRGWDESPLFKFLKAWFFPCSFATAVQGCPAIPCLLCNCCSFEVWWNWMFFPCPGVMEVTPMRTSPLLTPFLPFSPVPEHCGLPFAKGKADKKECASLLSLAPPFHSLLSNFY